MFVTRAYPLIPREEGVAFRDKTGATAKCICRMARPYDGKIIFEQTESRHGCSLCVCYIIATRSQRELSKDQAKASSYEQ